MYLKKKPKRRHRARTTCNKVSIKSVFEFLKKDPELLKLVISIAPLLVNFALQVLLHYLNM